MVGFRVLVDCCPALGSIFCNTGERPKALGCALLSKQWAPTLILGTKHVEAFSSISTSNSRDSKYFHKQQTKPTVEAHSESLVMFVAFPQGPCDKYMGIWDMALVCVVPVC